MDVKDQHKQTLLQMTSIMERRTTLLKHLQRFGEIQHIHMPGFDLTNRQPKAKVEDIKLFVPSDLSKTEIHRYCPHSLASLEDHICFAEASDSLEDLCHHLRTRSFTNKFKIANVTGQIHNTQAREVQHRINDRVRTAELRY